MVSDRDIFIQIFFRVVWRKHKKNLRIRARQFLPHISTSQTRYPNYPVSGMKKRIPWRASRNTQHHRQHCSATKTEGVFAGSQFLHLGAALTEKQMCDSRLSENHMPCENTRLSNRATFSCMTINLNYLLILLHRAVSRILF